MHVRLCSALVSLVALHVPAALSAGSIVLTPVLDNTLIEQTNPALQVSNALGDVFFVGRTNQPTGSSLRRGLVQFLLDGNIPNNANITGVTLTMRETSGMNGDRTTVLKRVTTEWGEGTSSTSSSPGAAATNGDATWLYAKYNTNSLLLEPWSSAGGDFLPAISGSTIVHDDAGASQAAFFTWSSATPGNSQMIADVQYWLTNPTGNLGWVVLGEESVSQTAKRFNSKDSAFPPQLEVTYIVPEPSSFMLAALGAMAGLAIVRRRRCN